jgi:hypothetical protein
MALTEKGMVREPIKKVEAKKNLIKDLSMLL